MPLPKETWLDVLRSSSRYDFDSLALATRTFRIVISTQLGEILRPIDEALYDWNESHVLMKGMDGQEIEKYASRSQVQKFFNDAIKDAYVVRLSIVADANMCLFKSVEDMFQDVSHHVSTTKVERLVLRGICGQAGLHAVHACILSFASVSQLEVEMSVMSVAMRENFITDDFLRQLAARGIWNVDQTSDSEHIGEPDWNVSLTWEGVFDYCFGHPDIQNDRILRIKLYTAPNADLFDRILNASKASVTKGAISLDIEFSFAVFDAAALLPHAESFHISRDANGSSFSLVYEALHNGLRFQVAFPAELTDEDLELAEPARLHLEKANTWFVHVRRGQLDLEQGFFFE